MKALVEYLAKALVEKPDAVAVVEHSTADGLAFELHVASEDLGRIIGRKGQTVKAIRQVMTAAAAKAKMKVSLLVQE